jgi:hypothetical protein
LLVDSLTIGIGALIFCVAFCRINGVAREKLTPRYLFFVIPNAAILSAYSSDFSCGYSPACAVCDITSGVARELNAAPPF